MSFLNDVEIKALILGNGGVIDKLPHEGGWASLPAGDQKWDSYESPIQPCSLDLHVGEIFVPDTPKDKLGGEDKGHTSYSLKSGHSVIVSSHERLNLPEDIGAIALPPSRISSSGILIANFGHIDPGYSGHLRFTIINMGKEEFSLVKGELVITLLLFRTSKAAVPFNKRRQPQSRDERPEKKEIDKLSRDFADFSRRAKEIAKIEVEGSGWQKFLIPMAVATTVAVLGYFITVYGFLKTDLDKIYESQKSYAVLQSEQNELTKRLDKEAEQNSALRDKIHQLEMANTNMSRDMERIQEENKKVNGWGWWPF